MASFVTVHGSGDWTITIRDDDLLAVIHKSIRTDVVFELDGVAKDTASAAREAANSMLEMVRERRDSKEVCARCEV
jgi:hypothetical protein